MARSRKQLKSRRLSRKRNVTQRRKHKMVRRKIRGGS